MRLRCSRWLTGIAILAAVAVAPGVAGAADDATPGPLPGHSAHGEAFDEGPRRAAHLMGQTGKVRFQITAKAPEAQQLFEQGVGQLHGFWYLEAERSFRQVAALDADCAMAYWGMALANVNNEKRAKVFLAEAVKRNKGLTKYEAAWIDALSTYYPADNKKDEKARRRDYVRKLEAIVQEFPNEAEPKAFLALQIWSNEKQWPISSHQAVDALLDQVFAIEPMHPAHHYRIHLWDGEKPERALASAARCGQAAPRIAHMWHMPGHTYSKVHRYEDAAWQQEASSRVDHANMVRDRVMPYQIHNYFHNQEWLVRDLAYLGRVRDAVGLAKNLVELPRHPKHNVATNRNSGADFGRTRLMEVLAQFELWDEYIRLADTVYLDDDGTPESKVKRARYLGVAHAAKGDREAAEAQVKALEAMREKPKARPQTAPADKPQPTTRNAKGPQTRPTTAPARRGRNQGNQRDLKRDIDRAVAHIRGQLALASKDYKKAEQYLSKSELRPDKMAQVHLAAGDNAKAEQLAKQAVEGNKNQLHPLAVYVDVLYQAGKKDQAKAAFENLRSVSSRPDLNLPVLARLAPLAKEFGFGDDWRVERPHAADAGERPSLDALGPFRWHPSAAPEFHLPTADRRSLGTKDMSGKPVVVLFYLGHGCVHCTEQLNKFAPLVKDYESAGISVVAVSTDSVEELSKSLSAVKSDGADKFPIPLVSDAGLGVFKQYHAYDDFENVPLHGTFLIDGRGLIRWQDIAAEPFMDPKFLLAESKRLLAQDKVESATAR